MLLNLRHAITRITLVEYPKIKGLFEAYKMHEAVVKLCLHNIVKHLPNGLKLKDALKPASLMALIKVVACALGYHEQHCINYVIFPVLHCVI